MRRLRPDPVLSSVWPASIRTASSAFLPSIALACALLTSTARAQTAPAGSSPDTAGPETCVAVFTVMAYAYADDDLKERLLEEKKLLALTDMAAQSHGAETDVQAQEPGSMPTGTAEERLAQQVDSLTGMMLDQPAQAQAVAAACFAKYPPAIELN
ncbi:hypothetical protein ACQKKX_12605 [Neorhizobium sp. NPDC001467]|uniref:hypothetical protein n=1 Tax=Neorhizobium sp. NPDC001467 TaxID=3390595 RepID=UPI003D074DD4